METLFKDLRYGYRTLLRNPGFTFIAVLSLALGIGANSAIFSFINTVLLKPLPVKNPGELVLFGDGTRRGDSNGPASGPTYLFSWREYHDFVQANRVFQDILAENSSSNRIYAAFTGDREPVLSTFVSGNFFHVLGIGAQAGRVFDAAPTTARACRLFSATRSGPAAFIAIQPCRFGVSSGRPRIHDCRCGCARLFGTRVGESPDLWMPVTAEPGFTTADSIKLQDPKSHFLNLIGRLKPGSRSARRRRISV